GLRAGGKLRCAPLPLVGRGWGWGSRDGLSLATPTPARFARRPSPQGGGEQIEAAAPRDDGPLPPPPRHPLQAGGQLLGIELGERRGAVAARRLARRNEQQLRVLHALERRIGDAGLRRIALVVARVDRQHGCLDLLQAGRGIVVARGFPSVEI